MDKKQNQNLDIQIDKDVATGVYSNLAVINHSPSEFVLDFIQMMPGLPKAQVRSRVIITPEHAKRLAKALNDNIHKFEMQFGEINDHEPPQMPLNYGPTGEA